MKTYDLSDNRAHTDHLMFLDGHVNVQRYDVVKYPQIEAMSQRALGLFWRPEEVDLSKDRTDFQSAPDNVKHIFESNIKRQIVLDSVQCRAPATVFMEIASLPEVEDFIGKWSFFESIHSRSYTHILRNVYPNPTEVFDGVNDIREIAEMGRDISVWYDRLAYQNNLRSLRHMPGIAYNEFEHKTAIWMALMASNSLEGLRFFLSFSSAFRSAENKMMEGNAKIMKLICRDEIEHLKFTVFVLLNLVKEDPDFAKIAALQRDAVMNMFRAVVAQEKEWGRYLMSKGSILGLNESLMSAYMDHLAYTRLADLGMEWDVKARENPLPFMDSWVSYGRRQAALQETENDAYMLGMLSLEGSDTDLSGITIG